MTRALSPEEQSELIVTVCERFMRGYLRDLPEIEEWRQQSRRLFPTVDENGVFGLTVLDRLDRLEAQVRELLQKVQMF